MSQHCPNYTEWENSRFWEYPDTSYKDEGKDDLECGRESPRNGALKKENQPQSRHIVTYVNKAQASIQIKKPLLWDFEDSATHEGMVAKLIR